MSGWQEDQRGTRTKDSLIETENERHREKETLTGGAPINLLTENRSIYSLMSIRTIAFSSLNKKEHNALQRAVLPTPIWIETKNGIQCP